MPALANTTRKSNRALFARLLANVTFGLGISTATALLMASAHAQRCDQCDSKSSPNCGCESPSSTKVTKAVARECNCKHEPKPSLGEMLLSRLDKVGDRIEAKARKSSKCSCEPRPDCGCESTSTATASCGCNPISSPKTSASQSVHQSQIITAHQSPNVMNRTANGSIGDKSSGEKSIGQSAVPTAITPNKTTKQIPTSTAPGLDNPPKRIPFEPRSPAEEHSRIPANDLDRSSTGIPNTLKPVPSDPPPAWSKTEDIPTKIPTLKENTKLPDVLVDPFKDDASFKGTKQNSEGIVLTSDRQPSAKTLRLVPSHPLKDDTESDLDSQPQRLTPEQRVAPVQAALPSFQFGANSNEIGQVVPSNYIELVPIKVAARKESSVSKAADMPQVPKIKVPVRR